MLEELRPWQQWVVHAPDKVPLRVVDGLPASCNEPGDWATFESASALVTANPYYGLGFVLTQNDPFTVVDLDSYKTTDAGILQLHQQIYKEFDTYTELSPSKGGVHIWCRGKVTGQRISDKHIEVYSSGRYMTVTLDAINNQPIEERQAQLDKYFSIAVVSNVHSSIDTLEVLTDTEILTKCAQAANGDLFKELWQGNWKTLYTSQSEADIALVNILAFYTDSKKQVARLFQASSLGKRQKAKRKDYLFNAKWGIISKAFDQKVPPVDISIPNPFATEVNANDDASGILSNPFATLTSDVSSTVDWVFPAGLLGMVSRYIFESSIYPCKEVAIAAAIGLLAGIAGRAYNTTTHTGLNQYLVLLADTGQGKEGASRGISTLTAFVKPQCPDFDKFIGPTEIASPQGLLNYFGKTNCFLAQRGEVGFWMQRLNAPNAGPNETGLKGLLLDLFHKSGHLDMMWGSAYADQSKNAPSLSAPCLSFLGDSTPQEFFKSLDDRNINEGLVSRFTVIACADVKPVYNANGPGSKPSDELIKSLALLGQKCKELNMIQQTVIVPETEDAAHFSSNYQKECQEKVWLNRTTPTAKIWQRAHIRLLRLGTLLAVGRNILNPVVTLDDYRWAEMVVNHGVELLIARFEKGGVGGTSLAHDQLKSMRTWIDRYVRNNDHTESQFKSMRCTKEMHAKGMFTRAAMQQGVWDTAPFRNSPVPLLAFQHTIDALIKLGVISKLDPMTAASIGKRGDVFVVVDYDSALYTQ